jgi:hypothetical protein
MVDFTVLQDTLEKDILPTITRQIYNRSILWQLFGGAAEGTDGSISENRVNTPNIQFLNNQFYVTLETGNMATSSIATGENVTYGEPQLDQGSIAYATATMAFLIPKAILNVKDGGAIVNTLNYTMKSGTRSLTLDLNRQAYADGSATLAYASASGTSTTTVNLQPMATGSLNTNWNGDIPLATFFFAVNGFIQVGSSGIVKVTGITGPNQITVSSPITFSAGAAVVKYTASNTVSSDLTGLAEIVNTNTYMNINPSVDATWSANVYNTLGGFNIHNWDNIYQQAQITGDVKVALLNKTQYTKFAESLTQYIRYSPVDWLMGGWTGIEYMGGKVSVILDNACPDTDVYMLSPEYLMKGELQPLEFEPGLFSSGQRLPQRIDYEVIADTMANFLTTLRSAHGVLQNQVG